MIGRKKKAIFSYLGDRLWRKIHNWSSKHLSEERKEVLIKSLDQAIPTYCMSTFLLPSSLGEETEPIMNSFWWGPSNNSNKGIKWMRREKLTVSKDFGGMGFRHLYGFNIELLGK